ncbi:MAG: thiol reductant ABC exporter subunit CydD [Treponema sp.]|jgi:ATP-binding cassette subfamily C protein CydD|nr:thiol reductant ABC exporter subunit CydD [Treponema sp.]
MLNKNLLRETKGSRKFLFGTAAAGLITGGLILAQAFLLARLANNVFLKGQNLEQVLPFFALLVPIVTLRALFSWLEEWFALHLAQTAQTSLREAILSKIDRLGPVRLRDEQTGELLHLITEGLEVLHAYFGKYMPQVFKTAIIPIMFFVMIFSRDWITGLILLFTAPMLPMFMMLIGKWSKSVTNKQWRALDRMTGFFQDLFQGLTTLKTLNMSKRQGDKVEALSESFRRNNLEVLRVAFLSALTLELFSTLSIAMVAVGLGLRLLNGMLEFEPAFFLLLLAPEFYQPIRNLGTQYHASLNGVEAANRVYRFLETPESEATAEAPGSGRDEKAGSGGEAAGFFVPPEQGGAVRAGDSGAPAAPAKNPANGVFGYAGDGAACGVSIVFDHVDHRYREAQSESLQDISFALERGQKTALVGPSGGGKTTILHLLLGFLSATGGRILAGGEDLAGLDMAAWRRRIAWVPQKPWLFAGTIRENLLIGMPGITDAAIREAGEDLGLRSWLEGLPEGLETRIGQGGRELSGGQRQLLAITRAWLRQSSLLLLDEATANLDLVREEAVQEALLHLMAGRTVLAAAHRLRTVSAMDRVLVIDGGRIVEDGPPGVLKASGGVYQSLLEAGGGE